MWIKNTLILLISTAVLSRPVPNPTPISVYQQGSGEEQQEYQQQQYTQPLQYKQQLVPQVRSAAAPLYKGQQEQNPSLLQQTQTEDYETEPPQPYQFSFDVNDDENTNYQNRKEQREGNKISGSYSVVDSDGFIRTVTYTADPVEGFKAHVSREPTNIVVKVPTHQSSADDSKGQHGDGKQLGLQYNGAPVPRPHIPASQQVLGAAVQGHQPTQQYVQSPQNLLQYQPVYQGQASLRHSQTASPAGQINQYLAEASPQAVHYSNPQLRG